MLQIRERAQRIEIAYVATLLRSSLPRPPLLCSIDCRTHQARTAPDPIQPSTCSQEGSVDAWRIDSRRRRTGGAALQPQRAQHDLLDEHTHTHTRTSDRGRGGEHKGTAVRATLASKASALMLPATAHTI